MLLGFMLALSLQVPDGQGTPTPELGAFTSREPRDPSLLPGIDVEGLTIETGAQNIMRMSAAWKILQFGCLTCPEGVAPARDFSRVPLFGISYSYPPQAISRARRSIRSGWVLDTRRAIRSPQTLHFKVPPGAWQSVGTTKEAALCR